MAPSRVMRSLSARLALLVCVAFLPMLALTTRELVKERHALMERAFDREADRVQAARVAHAELVADGRRYLGAVALLPQVASGDSLNCTRTVQRVRALLAEGWQFERFGRTGRTDCSSGDGNDGVESRVRGDERHRSTAEAADVMVGAYGIDRRRGIPTITLVKAVRDSTGQFAAHLAIRMHLTWVQRLAREVRRDSLTVVSIADDRGRLIMRSPEVGPEANARAGREASFDSMFTKGDGRTDGPGLDGIDRVWIHRALPAPDGRRVMLSVGVPVAPLAREANAALVRSLLTLAFSVVLVVLAARWAAQRFVLRDVRTLVAATERLAQGDLAVRSGLDGRTSELQQLGDAFDDMASRLAHRQERMAHAQKMESVGQLAGGVAHDFNNLLTVIVGNAESAKSTLDPAHPAHADIEHVLHAARRSGQLTRQLLAFARQHTFATRVMTLDRLLTNVSALLQRIIGEHIRLIVECDPVLSPTRVDPTQIEQAIINLAVNSRDAMPEGGTLTIAVRNLSIPPVTPEADADSVGDDDEGEPPGRWVAIAVTDSGAGMNAETRRRAFEPFFTTKPVGSGTGLGLSMVYGTVRQHGGHVRVSSAPGKGTTVRILLPVEETAEITHDTPVVGVPAVRHPEGNATVLLVEDERAVRAVTTRLLRAKGYRVIEAPDGAAALAELERYGFETIDLLVTDLVMPDLGGAELVRRVRLRRDGLPVLLMSGYSESGVPTALLEAPSTEFLEKPFSANDLLTAVRGLLDGQVATA